MLRYPHNANITLFCSLPQGESDRHIKAFIYKEDGSFALGGDGSLSMTHQNNGLYKSTANFTLPDGLYKVLYKPFVDPAYTQPDYHYGTSEETLEMYSDVNVDISEIEDKIDNIEDKIDSLSIQLQDSDFEIVVDDNQDEITIEVDSNDDESEIELEIEE